MRLGSSSSRALRGFAIISISRWPTSSFWCRSSSARATFSSLAGNDNASAIAIVQRWRSIGISGQPKRGPRMCCSISLSNAALCATAIQFGLLAASMNSGGTASPGIHSCTGSLSTA